MCHAGGRSPPLQRTGGPRFGGRPSEDRRPGQSAPARFDGRWLQQLGRAMRGPPGPTAQGLGDGLRDPHHDEPLRRIPVVLTAFVHHSNIAVPGGLLIGYHLIQFANLERSGVSPVVYADCECLFLCIFHLPRCRLIFMSLLLLAHMPRTCKRLPNSFRNTLGRGKICVQPV